MVFPLTVSAETETKTQANCDTTIESLSQTSEPSKFDLLNIIKKSIPPKSDEVAPANFDIKGLETLFGKDLNKTEIEQPDYFFANTNVTKDYLNDGIEYDEFMAYQKAVQSNIVKTLIRREKEESLAKHINNLSSKKERRDAIIHQFGTPNSEIGVSPNRELAAITAINSGNEKLAQQYLKAQLDWQGKINNWFRVSNVDLNKPIIIQELNDKKMKTIYVNRLPKTPKDASKILQIERNNSQNPDLHIIMIQRPKIFRLRHHQKKKIYTKMLINKVIKANRAMMFPF